MPTAHSIEGMRILVFNCTHGRTGTGLLQVLHETIIQRLAYFGEKENGTSFFDHAIFCTNVTYPDGNSKSGE
jgi:folylpolyglutamate synthase